LESGGLGLAPVVPVQW
jgi:anthrone oxygenase-like protein